MTGHHFVSLTVRVPSLLRYLSGVKMASLSYADEGALIKTAFAESFGGGEWPKPFAVRRRGGDGNYEILAYSRHSADALTSIYRPVPALADAIPVDRIMGYPLIAPAEGTALKFHTTFCPMVRTHSDKAKGSKGRERDVYTLEIEKAKEQERPSEDRMVVYRRFLDDRMKGARIIAAQPVGYSLTQVQRKTTDGTHRFAVPSITFSGFLTVTDPPKFLETIIGGIGRQRTYGFGMILLGAAAPKATPLQ